ncbi:hypothetical protein HanRHA438_Chr15g0699661 [Helianthus annuus]|nr:hypothetical protein HanRHA438_Chr15g0699661 [Helianthus annuus]
MEDSHRPQEILHKNYHHRYIVFLSEQSQTAGKCRVCPMALVLHHEHNCKSNIVPCLPPLNM